MEASWGQREREKESWAQSHALEIKTGAKIWSWMLNWPSHPAILIYYNFLPFELLCVLMQTSLGWYLCHLDLDFCFLLRFQSYSVSKVCWVCCVRCPGADDWKGHTFRRPYWCGMLLASSIVRGGTVLAPAVSLYLCQGSGEGSGIHFLCSWRGFPMIPTPLVCFEISK